MYSLYKGKQPCTGCGKTGEEKPRFNKDGLCMETKEYESIVQRILNLQKLVEQGIGGEAENARLSIEKIVRRYGLSLEEILADEKPEVHTWNVKTAREKHLFIQCLGVVKDTWQPAVLER